MTPHDATILQGNALELAHTLAPLSIDNVTCSPPYLAKRDYPCEPTYWPGDDECHHEWTVAGPLRTRTEADKGGNAKVSDEGENYNALSSKLCSKCGAWVGKLGGEPTPDLYIDHLIQILAAIRPALKDSGTIFLNLGDTRATHPAGVEGERRWRMSGLLKGPLGSQGRRNRQGEEQAGRYDKRFPGYQEKCLIGVPWLFAFAAMRDGWFLRNAIIWAKHPKPERVQDRLTDSYEFIFVLTKKARYYWNYEEARKIRTEDHPGADGNLLDVWNIRPENGSTGHLAPYPLEIPHRCIRLGCPKDGMVLDPFAGSGTTLVAAQKWGARSIGFELSEKDHAKARSRAHLDCRRLDGFVEA